MTLIAFETVYNETQSKFPIIFIKKSTVAKMPRQVRVFRHYCKPLLNFSNERRQHKLFCDK